MHNVYPNDASTSIQATHLCTMSMSTTMPSRCASSIMAFSSSGVPNLPASNSLQGALEQHSLHACLCLGAWCKTSQIVQGALQQHSLHAGMCMCLGTWCETSVCLGACVHNACCAQ